MTKRRCNLLISAGEFLFERRDNLVDFSSQNNDSILIPIKAVSIRAATRISSFLQRQMSRSRHSHRHTLPSLSSFSLGEDIDLAIGLTAGLLAGNELLESTLSDGDESQTSHLIKAGLGAVVAAGAFKMFGREHRENAEAKRGRSRLQRGHHGGDRIEDGEYEYRHGHRRRHHSGYHDDDYDDYDPPEFRTMRGHRHHLRESDEDRPYNKRYSFESSGSSRPSDFGRSRRGRAPSYQHDGDFGFAKLNLRDISPFDTGRSSRRHSYRSDASAGHGHGRPAGHVHFRRSG